MKIRQKVITGFLLAAIAAGGLLTGCGSAGESVQKEMNILERTNHLQEWEEELPQDIVPDTLNANAVRGLRIQTEGTITFAVSYEPREEKETFDYWDISVPYHSFVSVNTEELYDLFGMAAQIEMEEAEIGLEEAGIIDSKTSLYIAYDAEQETGEKGSPSPTASRTLFIGDEDGQGRYYVALGESEQVYLTDKVLVDTVLNVNPFQYILKLPVLIDVITISQVNIVSGETTHTMTQSSDAWKMDKKSVSQEEFQTLYSELLGILLSGELPDDIRFEEDRTPLLTLQFFRNMEGASDVEVKYYSFDENSMSVSVNGEEYFLVEKESIEALQKVIDENF